MRLFILGCFLVLMLVSSVKAQTTIVFPQFVTGQGISSELTIVNSSMFPMDGIAALFNDAGQAVTYIPMAGANAAFRIDSYGLAVMDTGASTAIASGSLIVRFDCFYSFAPPEICRRIQSIGAPNAILKTTIAGLGSFATGPSPSGTAFNLPIRQSNNGLSSFTTGIAIANLSPRLKTIRLDPVTPATPLGDGPGLHYALINIPAKGHRAGTIEELLPAEFWSWLGEKRLGLIISIDPIDSNDSIAVIGLQIGPESQLTIVPPVALKCEPPPSGRYLCPKP